MSAVGKMSLNEEELAMINKLQNHGILNKKIICLKCNSEVQNLVKKKRDENGSELISFRCKKCQKYRTVKENSFFMLYKTSMAMILQIIKFWCIQIPLVKAKELLELEKNDLSKPKSKTTVSLPVIDI